MAERDGDNDNELLHRAAERAGDQPFFLASLLLAYARAEGLNDAALARRLGCRLGDLPALLLCRRPTGESSTFQADVRRIADHFRLDPVHVAQIIRVAEALEALPSAPGSTTTADTREARLLAAARDRDDEPDDEDGEP